MLHYYIHVLDVWLCIVLINAHLLAAGNRSLISLTRSTINTLRTSPELTGGTLKTTVFTAAFILSILLAMGKPLVISIIITCTL